MKLYDQVVLNINIKKEQLHIGNKGTIVHCYSPTAFEVEFIRTDKTITTVMVPKSWVDEVERPDRYEVSEFLKDSLYWEDKGELLVYTHKFGCFDWPKVVTTKKEKWEFVSQEVMEAKYFANEKQLSYFGGAAKYKLTPD